MSATLPSIEYLPLELRRFIQDDLTLQDISRLSQCSSRSRRIWEPEIYCLSLVQDHCLIRACRYGNIALYELLLRYGVHPMVIRSGMFCYHERRCYSCKILQTDVLARIHQLPYLEAMGMSVQTEGCRAFSTLELAIQFDQITFFKCLLEHEVLSMIGFSGLTVALERRLVLTENQSFLKTMIQSEPHERLLAFFTVTRFPLASLIICGASAALVKDLIDTAPCTAAVLASRAKPDKILAINWAYPSCTLPKFHQDYSPITAALLAGSPENLSLLLSYGVELPDALHQSKYNPKHKPRTTFYFCATAERLDATKETFGICKAHGANINEVSYWPVVHDWQVHHVIMTPLFEYIYSLPLDIWQSEKAEQVLEVVKLFIHHGASLDPTNDNTLMNQCAIEPSSCTKKWLVKFALARWGAVTLNRPAFFGLIKLIFESHAARSFVPHARDIMHNAQSIDLAYDGNMKLMGLIMEPGSSGFSRDDLRTLLEYLKHLEALDSKRPTAPEFQRWTRKINLLCAVTWRANDETELFCTTCTTLARLGMTEAQIRQGYLYGHRDDDLEHPYRLLNRRE